MKTKRYLRDLEFYQRQNKIKGFGDDTEEWKRENYNVTLNMLRRAKREKEHFGKVNLRRFIKQTIVYIILMPYTCIIIIEQIITTLFKNFMATILSKTDTICEVKELVKFKGIKIVTNKDKLLCLYKSSLKPIYKLTFLYDIIVWENLTDDSSYKLESDYKKVEEYCNNNNLLLLKGE